MRKTRAIDDGVDLDRKVERCESVPQTAKKLFKRYF